MRGWAFRRTEKINEIFDVVLLSFLISVTISSEKEIWKSSQKFNFITINDGLEKKQVYNNEDKKSPLADNNFTKAICTWKISSRATADVSAKANLI